MIVCDSGSSSSARAMPASWVPNTNQSSTECVAPNACNLGLSRACVNSYTYTGTPWEASTRATRRDSQANAPSVRISVSASFAFGRSHPRRFRSTRSRFRTTRSGFRVT
jgi:hypothetical protein